MPIDQSRRSLQFLDGMRGLAALYVLLFHARWLLWEGFSEGFARHPERYSLLSKLVAYGSLLFYYGHQAVIFFFILSGFVIHLRYAQNLRADGQQTRFDLFPYLKRRARRIYPPLILALLVTFAADQIGMMRHLAIYDHHTPYKLINDVPVNDNATHLLQTGLLIAGTPAFGSNLPLWSLKLEWWFYLLYPLLWWLTRRSMRLASALLVIGFVLSLLPFMDSLPFLQSILSALIVWWFGALLAEVYVGRLPFRFIRIVPLALLLLVLPLLTAPLVVWNTAVQDLCWGLGFSGLLAALFAWQNQGRSLGILARLKPLGDMSYTLYVTHFPILFLISGLLMTQSGAGELPEQFGWIVSGAACCLMFAYVARWLVEKPITSQRRQAVSGVPVTSER